MNNPQETTSLNWDDIEKHPKFQSFDFDKKKRARSAYFDQHIATRDDYKAFDPSKQERAKASWNDWIPEASPDQNKGLAGDLVTSVKKGVLGLPGMVTGLADVVPALVTGDRPFDEAFDYYGKVTGFQPSKWSEDLNKDYSQKHKQQQYNLNKTWKDKNTNGWDVAAEYAKNPGYVLNQIAESVPSMFVGGALGRGAMLAGEGLAAAEGVATKIAPKALGYLEKKFGEKAAAAIAGGLGEGIVQTGQSLDQATGQDQRKNAIAALISGATDTLIGAGAGRLAQSMGLETAETLMAKGLKSNLTKELSVGGKVLGKTGKIVAGAASEGILQEFPQSAQEQIWQNYSNGKSLWDGVSRASIEGALAGMVMGAGANAISNIETSPDADTYEGQLQQHFDNIKSQGTEKIPASIEALTIKVNKNNQMLRDPEGLAKLAQESGYDATDLQTFLTTENEFNQDLVAKLQEELTGANQVQGTDPITEQTNQSMSMEDAINQFQADAAGSDQNVQPFNGQGTYQPDVMAPNQDVSLTQPDPAGLVDAPFVGNAADNTMMDIEQSMIDTSVDMQRQANMPNAAVNAKAKSLLHNSVLQKIRAGQEDTFTSEEGTYYDEYVTAMERQQKLNQRNRDIAKAQEEFDNTPGPELPTALAESMRAEALAKLPTELLTNQNKPYKSRKRLEARIASLPAEAEYVITETADGFIATKKVLPDSTTSPFINEQQLADPSQVADVPSVEQIALAEERLTTNQQQLNAINNQLVNATDPDERMALQQQSSALYTEIVSIQQQINKQYNVQAQAQGTPAEPNAETAGFEPQFQTTNQAKLGRKSYILSDEQKTSMDKIIAHMKQQEQQKSDEDNFVKDAQGNDLVGLHGTAAKPFDSFDNSKTQTYEYGWYGAGHYFTMQEASAKGYAEAATFDNAESGRIVEARFTFKNPIDASSDEYNEIVRNAIGNSSIFSKEDGIKVTKALQAAGYDAVYVGNSLETAFEINVFDSKDIHYAPGQTQFQTTDQTAANQINLADIEQLDKKYIEAINNSNNDLVTAQKLVDFIAKKNGYTDTVYHWGKIPLTETNAETANIEPQFQVRDYYKGGIKQKGEKLKFGSFITPIKKVAQNYANLYDLEKGSKVHDFTGAFDNIASPEKLEEVVKSLGLFNDELDQYEYLDLSLDPDIAKKVLNELKNQGYDAVQFWDYLTDGPEEYIEPALVVIDPTKINEKIQLQAIENQKKIDKVTLADIKKVFPNQTVIQTIDGSISVKFKNGKGLSIKSIQDAGQGFVKLAIETGQMLKKGTILGVTVGNEVLLDAKFADNKTLWHENKHVLDNLGIITEADNAALNKEFNKLRKADKLEFTLSTAINSKTKQADHIKRMEENRANMFAQIMVNREAYRGTPLGKLIQRAMDFFQQLFAFGKQTIAGLAREVESGKIYERDVNNTNTNNTSFNTRELTVPEQAVGGLLNKKTDTNTPEFKQWFGQSVAKKADGSPVELYHGTDAVFDTFTKDTESKTNHATSALGHFFSTNEKTSSKYGQHTLPVYLQMHNPYKMSLNEAQSLKTTDEAKQRQQDLLSSGYDSIIIETGAAPYIVVFDSSQVKSVYNQGDWKAADNIYFETRNQGTEQKLSDAQYEALRRKKKNILQNIVRKAKIRITDAKLLADKAFTPISTRLGLIDKELLTQLKEMDFRTTQRIIDILTPANEMLDIIHGKKNKLGVRQGGIPKADRDDWNVARLQADTGKIEQLAQRHGLTEHLNIMREKLNQIRLDAKAVGYDIGFVDEYWPRIIKDREKFLQTTEEISQEPVFTQAFREQAKKLGVTQEVFESDFSEVRADIISNILLGHDAGIGGPGNIKSRVFKTIPDEYIEFYMDADASLMQYVYSMSKKIEARKFFGKVPARISALKAAKKKKHVEIIKYQQLAKSVRTDNPDAFIQYKEKIDSLKEDLALIEAPLNKYKSQNNFTENIGTYINDLMLEGRIKKQDEKTVRDIFNARFNEQGTHGIVNAFKNASYIDVMGSPLSAITQIGDLAFAMYVGKVWTPKGFIGTAKNLSKAMRTRSDITKEDLGFERIAQEFTDNTTLGKAVSKVFKLVGLEKMDSIGKEVLINNALDQYKLQAKADPKVLAKTIRPIFKGKTDSVIQELMAYDSTNPNDVPSDNIKLLLYSKVLDFQPIALSEMPEFYLIGGNGRIVYMLKTYTIKQFDVFRREVFHNIKKGTPKQKIQGIKNMVQLAALLTLANASADEIKDFMLGKEIRFRDTIIENFLSLGGASRYIKMKISRDGLGTALSQQALPPVKFINSISKDLQEGYENYVSGDTGSFDHARIIESIPGAGKLYYWHYGRGSQTKKTLNEKDFTKAGKRFRKFKKKIEKASDKRLFLQTNADEFKQMLLYQNMRKPLNENKADINALKKLEQTPAVIKRLGQLEKYRKLIYERYFEAAKNLTAQ